MDQLGNHPNIYGMIEGHRLAKRLRALASGGGGRPMHRRWLASLALGFDPMMAAAALHRGKNNTFRKLDVGSPVCILAEGSNRGQRCDCSRG